MYAPLRTRSACNKATVQRCNMLWQRRRQGIDPSPQNIVAAATIGAPPADVKVQIRLETNAAAQAYRLTVHSTVRRFGFRGPEVWSVPQYPWKYCRVAEGLCLLSPQALDASLQRHRSNTPLCHIAQHSLHGTVRQHSESGRSLHSPQLNKAKLPRVRGRKLACNNCCSRMRRNPRTSTLVPQHQCH